ncbi:MAG: class I SAM-dependent methyltransferase, partial [Pseudomonadota bacterium]
DFSEGMIAEALKRPQAENVKFRQADAFDPAFEPQSFDVVLALNLLHLVPDATETVARITDLLRPGGVFISKTPSLKEPGLGWKFWLMKQAIPVMQRMGKAPYVRFYDFASIEQEMHSAGLRIIETGNYPVRPPNHFVVAQKT